MSRFLFVLPPFVAHVHPVLGIGAALESRGHAVAWVTDVSTRNLLKPGSKLYPFEHALDSGITASSGLPLIAGYKSLMEDVLVPLAYRMLPYVEDAIADFCPDVVVADQQALAGPLAARLAGRTYATSAPSAGPWSGAFDMVPGMREWTETHFEALQRSVGLEPIAELDCSPELLLLYTTPEFADPQRRFPPNYRFVGPSIHGREDDTPFPWHALRDGPRVLASLGTLFFRRGVHFFSALVEALTNAPVQVIVSAPQELFATVPDNFIVQPWVPLPALYEHIDAVICHAGSMVSESLLHGLPMVVAPIAQEQGFIAERAVTVGAAIRVSVRRARAQDLRDAVLEIIRNPGYRSAARRIQQSFVAAGGALAAARELEGLARAHDQSIVEPTA